MRSNVTEQPLQQMVGVNACSAVISASSLFGSSFSRLVHFAIIKNPVYLIFYGLLVLGLVPPVNGKSIQKNIDF